MSASSCRKQQRVETFLMAQQALVRGLTPLCGCQRPVVACGRLTHQGFVKARLASKVQHIQHTRSKRMSSAPAAQSSATQADSEATDKQYEAFDQHQASAPRLDFAEEARTILQVARTGTLSTVASDGPAAGFPSGSVVEYAPDEQGRPIFMISSISPHTKHLKKDSRCSFTVLAPAFRSVADARVSVTGHAKLVPDDQQASFQQQYMKANTGSFWADFGDFKAYHMAEVLAVHFNGGFGRAGTKVTAEQVLAAMPDPVAHFAPQVADHMNKDHQDALKAMVKHFTGLTVDDVAILTLDRLGMDCTCTKDRSPLKCRLPYTRPVKSRVELKDVIVEMSKEAKVGALSSAEATQMTSEVAS